MNKTDIEATPFLCEKREESYLVGTGCAEQMDFYSCLEEMQKYKQPKIKKVQRETKSVDIPAITSGSVRIGDIFSYQNNTYVYIGVKADEKWVANQIMAVKTKYLKNGIKDRVDLFFIQNRELPFTFEIPLERMPGHCAGYQLDTVTGEMVIHYVQPDREIRCETKLVKKKQLQTIKRLQVDQGEEILQIE